MNSAQASLKAICCDGAVVVPSAEVPIPSKPYAPSQARRFSAWPYSCAGVLPSTQVNAKFLLSGWLWKLEITISVGEQVGAVLVFNFLEVRVTHGVVDGKMYWISPNSSL